MKYNNLKFSLVLILFSIISMTAQKKVYSFNHIDKVIVNPHIQVTFEKGDKEELIIESINESIDKLNVDDSEGTVEIYLDDARIVTKSKKVDNNDWKGRQSLYNGTVVKATFIYKSLEKLSLRGEQDFLVKDLLEAQKFELNIYGESEVTLNKVDFNTFKCAIYGENELKIKSGKTTTQKFTVYGDSEVNVVGVDNMSTKITSYGEAEFKIKVSNNLKVTAYGETTIDYLGNPTVDKGIVIGETRIRSIE